jgi:hypothetical protein
MARQIAACSRPASLGSTVLRLQPDAIVDRVSEPLLTADVSLGGLDALVPEEELDLLDLTARVMTEAGASAPQIVRSDTGQTALHRRRSLPLTR